MLFWLIVVGYLGMWYLTAGMMFYHEQTRWPDLAEIDRASDRAASLVFGSLWVVTLPFILFRSPRGFLNPFSKGITMLSVKQMKQVVAACVAKTLLNGSSIINTQRKGDDKYYNYLVGLVDNKIILVRHGFPFGVRAEILEPENYRGASMDYNVRHAMSILTVWSPWNFRQYRLVKKKIAELKAEADRNKKQSEIKGLNDKLNGLGINLFPKE